MGGAEVKFVVRGRVAIYYGEGLMSILLETWCKIVLQLAVLVFNVPEYAALPVGISLSVEQWEKLKEAIPQIDEQLGQNK